MEPATAYSTRHVTKVPNVTDTPNSWTDGYGTVHAGPPPEGYWIASDARWYAPELHPDALAAAATPVPETAEPAGEPASFGEALADPTAFDPSGAEPAAFAPAPFDPAPFDPAAVEPVTPDPTSAEQATFDPATLGRFLEPEEPPTDQPLTDQMPPEPVAPAWEQPRNWDPSAPAEGTAPTPVAAQPPTEPTKPPSNTTRLLVGGGLGLIALLGLGAAAYTVLSGDDTTSGVIAGESPATTATDSDTGSDTDTDTDTSTENETGGDDSVLEVDTTTTEPAGGDDTTSVEPSNAANLDGIESCTRIDSETLEVSMVNVSDKTASYLLTVIYLDEAGDRVGDDNVYVSSLRPGERAIEQSYVFNDAGIECEVIEADRYDRNGEEGLEDISACTIRPPTTYGYTEADVTATNSGTADFDYTVEVAFVDADDVRRGVGTAYIERARIGETAPGEIYSIVPYDENLRCEVVAVTRFESS